MKQLVLLAFGLMFSANVWAADGSSGCGPGWYVFKENSLISSSLRATTNGILFPTVTIGMTVGTSNCSKHKIVKNEKRSLHFATNSYYELKGDIAKGEGEHLAAFTSTLGCKSLDSSRAHQELKRSYDKIYPSQNVDPERALLEVYKVIFSDKTLAQQCLVG